MMMEDLSRLQGRYILTLPLSTKLTLLKVGTLESSEPGWQKGEA